MSDLAIRVRGLGKRYRIGRWEPYQTLRETITRLARAPLGWLRPSAAEEGDSRELWALRDVSFDVRRGETLGIIGRNGAGKSTLLKVLARITPPTEGEGEVRGRFRALLEVGTGFHPELTGRENIFLNGAILGMSRREIRSKLDEIVSFSEVQKFLDTPVKHYSSGMYIRLAFSVAAHLEPEILVIDEVLAVGDVAFQKKCMDKMEEAGRQGRTVILVSHNLNAIRQLCRRILWIDGGRVRADGEAEKIMGDYLTQVAPEIEVRNVLAPLGDFVVDRVVLRNGTGEPCSEFRPGARMTVEVGYEARAAMDLPYLWMMVNGPLGPLFTAHTFVPGLPNRVEGRGVLRFEFPALPLAPNLYRIRMGARDRSGHVMLLRTADVADFRVVSEEGPEGNRLPLDQDGWSHGLVRIPYGCSGQHDKTP